MKTITEYQCEVCRNRYNTKEQAENCEKEGVFDTSNYPIGLMYSWHHNGYVGIFAVNECTEFLQNKHLGNISTWCYRTKGYPPFTLDENSCSYPYLLRNSDVSSSLSIPKEEVGNEEFTKMVKYLKDKGITPKYYEEGSIKLIEL